MIKAVVVDDNTEIGPMIQHSAEQAGIDAVVFADGAEALSYLTNEEHGSKSSDVVLLDLMMSPLDGVTVAQEIRRNEEIRLIQPPVKIAFLTAAFINDTIERAADGVKAEKIFRKPCDYVEMFNEVKGWFDPARSAT